MPQKQPQLAKTSRPRLYNAVPRERLFSLLDRCMGYAVTWVAGPPGAGKTTLVATYLDATKRPVIWYQADSGDTDPASFFYYLALAASRWSRKGHHVLPLLRTVKPDELPGFTRRFFRQLFSLLPSGAVLTIDNFQEAADPLLSGVLCHACAEIPSGQSAVLISRGEPPVQFAELQARDALVQIGWNDLRLTLEETRSMCARRGVDEDWLVRALHQQSDGWAAGVTLMLERLRHADGDARTLDSDVLEGVFDYFAGLIVERMPEDARRMLLSLAFLPYFTASAARWVSGFEAAGKVLEQLFRRHLFTNRRPGNEPVYQFHALFRGFLQNRAVQFASAQELTALTARSAAAAEAAGEVEAAFELYVRAQDWQNAIRLILREARVLLDVGRWQTLEQWILTIPLHLVEADPWLEYWLATARAQTNPMAAVSLFEHAQRRFLESGDRGGRVMSLSGLMHACSVDHRGYEIMDSWLDVLAEELASPPQFAANDFELEAQGALLWAAFFLRPWHPCIVPCLERVEALLAGEVRPNLSLGPAGSALGVAAQMGDLDRSERLVALVERLSSRAGVSPVDSVWGRFQIAFQRFMAAKYEASVDALNRAWSLAEANGLQDVLQIVLIHRLMIEFRVGDRAVAETTLKDIEAMNRPPNLTAQVCVFYFQALRALHRGEARTAADLAERSQEAVVKSRSLYHEMVFGLINADPLLQAGYPDRAEPLISRSRALMKRSEPLTNHGAVLALVEAWFAEQQGRSEDSLRFLADALAIAGKGNGWVRLRFNDLAMRHMFPIALERGIEPELVVQLIRRFRLEPEDVNLGTWPWPIRVRALGPFEVLLDDNPLKFERKMPKKALALLKVLVAIGPREIPEREVVDALWSDEEGDSAHMALKVTLLRLRRLLGDHNAIRQTGGKLAIDRKRCWVDAWAFEYRLSHREPLGSEQGLRRLEGALGLYRGTFLSDDSDQEWVVPAQERLRAKYVHAVVGLAGHFEEREHHDEAITWYLKGLDADPVVEAFYQGLMRCYHKLGRRSEAIAAYQRLAQMLSITLGLRPAAATERLYQSIRAG